MKLTKTDIKQKADEWARLEKQISKLEAKRNAELDPHIRKFEKATKPIYDKHDPKIEKLRTEKNAVAEQIFGWLKLHKKTVLLEGELAEAANESKLANRVIPPQKFFEVVRKKNSAFWDCVTIAIAKAEKLLGKTTVDEISEKPKKLEASLRLK